MRQGKARTAWVFAGGGSLGAVQVGMLKALIAHGLKPDLVVGASAGAINGAYLAGRPDAAGIAELERLWLTTRRHISAHARNHIAHAVAARFSA